MERLKKKQLRRIRLKKSIRGKVFGSVERPRLTVYRSNNEIYAQIINDDLGKTIVSASSIEASLRAETGNGIEMAIKVGKAIAEKAVQANISKVVFDRNGFLYHGRVKALADAARESGLKF